MKNYFIYMLILILIQGSIAISGQLYISWDDKISNHPSITVYGVEVLEDGNSSVEMTITYSEWYIVLVSVNGNQPKQCGYSVEYIDLQRFTIHSSDKSDCSTISWYAIGK